MPSLENDFLAARRRVDDSPENRDAWIDYLHVASRCGKTGAVLPSFPPKLVEWLCLRGLVVLTWEIGEEGKNEVLQIPNGDSAGDYAGQVSPLHYKGPPPRTSIVEKGTEVKPESASHLRNYDDVRRIAILSDASRVTVWKYSAYETYRKFAVATALWAFRKYSPPGSLDPVPRLILPNGTYPRSNAILEFFGEEGPSWDLSELAPTSWPEHVADRAHEAAKKALNREKLSGTLNVAAMSAMHAVSMVTKTVYAANCAARNREKVVSSKFEMTLHDSVYLSAMVARLLAQGGVKTMDEFRAEMAGMFVEDAEAEMVKNHAQNSA